MKRISRGELPASDARLVEAALTASANAYAPYSAFAVGAAVLTASGAIYAGANIENASYGLSFCAEVSALATANGRGDYNVQAIAVVGHRFVPPISVDQIVSPCGRCRQLILEAAQVSGRDVRVLSCNGDLSEILVATISELLPEAFGPADLGLDRTWKTMQQPLRDQVERLRGGLDAPSAPGTRRATGHR